MQCALGKIEGREDEATRNDWRASRSKGEQQKLLFKVFTFLLLPAGRKREAKFEVIADHLHYSGVDSSESRAPKIMASSAARQPFPLAWL